MLGRRLPLAVLLASVCVCMHSLCGLSDAFPAADGIAAFPDFGPP